ncbi:uncharacterized protein JCM10292_004737 [Rhodotorula paludigena]|uniref:uncharacterized protein n=1 Tax=Rhodotorula paludigena TaxID=86838 RepID=UPI00317A2799
MAAPVDLDRLVRQLDAGIQRIVRIYTHPLDEVQRHITTITFWAKRCEHALDQKKMPTQFANCGTYHARFFLEEKAERVNEAIDRAPEPYDDLPILHMHNDGTLEITTEHQLLPAKRVLCHPNPAGCPRCVEKGYECTTTPVVRRKPQKRKQAPPEPRNDPLPAGEEAASSAPVASTSAVTLGAPESSTATDSVTGATVGVAGLDSSDIPVPAAALCQTPSLPAFPSVIPSSAPTQSSTSGALVIAYNTSPHAHLINPSPDLTRHLCECFRQTAQYDHPIVRGPRIRELLEPVRWQLSLLPPEPRVYVYCALTVGAFFSFDPAFIGHGELEVSSFREMETICDQLKDLREYGRRRKTAVDCMRDTAVAMAKGVDALTRPSVDNAATCLMIDFLTRIDDSKTLVRPWLSAHMTHIRALCDEGDLDGVIWNNPVIWAVHLGSNLLTEVESGRISSTLSDQLLLTRGAKEPDLDQLEKNLRGWVSNPQTDDSWRHTFIPFALAFLSIGRELVDKILTTHARIQPFDEPAVSRFFQRLQQFRTCVALQHVLLDRLIDPKDRPTFPHAAQRRVRYTSQIILRGTRSYTSCASSALIVPLYRELVRRFAESDDAVQAAPLDTSVSEREQLVDARDRLDLLVRQVRRLVPDAVDLMVEAMHREPHIALYFLQRTTGLVDWTAVLLQDIETGATAMTDKIAHSFEKLAALFKLTGYSQSSTHVDQLILVLEQHVFAYRLAQSLETDTPSVVPTQPQPNAQPFQFAYLSELVGSNENSPRDPPATAAAAQAAGLPSHVDFAPPASHGLAPAGATTMADVLDDALLASLIGSPGTFPTAATSTDTSSDYPSLSNHAEGATSAGSAAGSTDTFSPEQLEALLTGGSGGPSLEGGQDADAFMSALGIGANFLAGWGAW